MADKGYLMKKFFRVCCLVIFSLMMMGFVSPCLNLAALGEEQEQVTYALVPNNFNERPTETMSKYHIDPNLTYGLDYNPIDEEHAKKREGMCFALPTTTQNQIENQYITPLSPDVDEDEFSLFIWINFNSIVVHNLDIVIEFEGGSSIAWRIKQEVLESLVKKNPNSVVEVDPFGWNQLELPFSYSLAETQGQPFVDGKLSKIERIVFDYTSDVQNENERFAALRFYDLYLAQSTNKDKISVIKQNYVNYSFNFEDEDLVSSFILGDSMKVMRKDQAINYAYYGDENLLGLPETVIKWKVKISSPEDDQPQEIDWGSTVNFDKEGTWTLYYQCIDLRKSDTSSQYDTPLIVGHQTIVISKINGLYFDNQRMNMQYGKNYILYVHITDMFTSVSDISFEYNSEELTVEYLGDGSVRVSPLKAGEFTLTAKVEGTRKARPEQSTYSSSITISATKDEDKYAWLRITLWVLLGVSGVVLIAITIKLFVKARKFDVK